MSHDDRQPRWDLAVLLIILLGGVLRFIALGQQSYWVDEIRSVIIATGGPQGRWIYAVFNIHGPLSLVLLKIWMMIFGSAEAATRLMSAIFGLLGLPLFYRVAVNWIGRRAALFALLLLACSPFHLWYSQETRNYAMFFDIALVAFPAYLYEIERRTRLSFLGALAISVVACLSNLTGFFLLGIYGFFAVTIGHRARYPLWRAIMLVVITGLLLSPWITRTVQQMGQPQLGRPSDAPGQEVVVRGESPVGLLSIPFTFYVFSLGLSTGPSIHELKTHHWSVVKPHLPYLVPAMLVVALVALGGLRAIVRKRSPALLVLLTWLCIPILLMVALSALNLKAPNPRYAIASFIPYLWLLGTGVAAIRHRLWRCIVLGLLLVAPLHSVYRYFNEPRYWRPDGRAVGETLAAESRPTDVLVNCGVPEPMEFYAPKHLFVFQRPPRGAFVVPAAAERWLRETTAGKERLWYVKINGWWGDPEERLLKACRQMMIPAGEWQHEKAPLYLFEVPPQWRGADAPAAGANAANTATPHR